MTPDPGDPGPLRARPPGAADPHAHGTARDLFVAAPDELRADVDAARAAGAAMRDDAATLVADHGRTLVRLERAHEVGHHPPAPAEPGGADADDPGVVRNTALSLLTQVATATATAILTLFLIRHLDPAAYGVFSLTIAITGLFLLPADFGISGSAARFVAEARRDPRARALIIADALRLKLVIGVVLAGALVAVAAPAARIFDTPALETPLRLAAIALLGQSLIQLFSGTFIAVGRLGSNLRLIATESAIELTASVALVLAGAGAAGAVAGRGVGYALGALFGLVVAARTFGRTAVAPGLRPRTSSRRLIRYAGALFVVDGAYTLFNQVDILIIGRLLGSASVGLFAAPLRLCAVLHYPGLAVSNAVAPRLARGDGNEPDIRSFSTALRGLIVLQVAIAVTILIWARPIVDLLLGSRYGEAVGVLRALTPYILLQGVGPLITVSVNYLGQARRRAPIAVAAVAVNLVIDIILIPRIGIIGGAIGTSVAYAIYVPGHFLICHRILRFDVRPIVRTCVRSALAGAAMALPLLYTLDGGIYLRGWLLGGGAALAAFCGVLLLTGEVRVSDVRKAAARVRASRTRAA